MAVINTNVKALFSQAALKSTERSQSVAMQQLSTGKRINSARDDAAGMAIATRMTHQIRSLNQAVRNAGDAVSLIQTAEGATNEITDMMQRMRELAVQAVNDTNSNPDRSYLDLEFQQLKQEIVRVSDTTEWNGFKVLNGTAGERVGEMPLFKVTSENQFGSVFIDPTTSRTLSGSDGGEQQTLTFTGTATSNGDLDVAGVKVPITSGDTYIQIANKVQSYLSNSHAFGTSSGRSVVVNTSGVVTITYAASEGAMADTEVKNANVIGIASPTVATTRQAITSGTEMFKEGGSFLKSGSLKITTDTSTAVTEKSKVTFQPLLTGENVNVGGLTFTSNGGATAAELAQIFAQISDGTPGNPKVTFAALAVDKSVTIAGLTLTNTTGAVIAAADVAKAFSALNNGDTTSANTPAGATWSGKFTGFNSPAYVTAATSVNFVSDPLVAKASLNESTTGTALTVANTSTINPTVTFTATLANNAAVTIAGLTLTNTTGSAIAIADLAKAFSGLTNGDTTPGFTPADSVTGTTATWSGTFTGFSSPAYTPLATSVSFTNSPSGTYAPLNPSGTLTVTPKGEWSGSLTGFTAGQVTGTTSVEFSSTTASADVTDLVVTTNAATAPTVVNTAAYPGDVVASFQTETGEIYPLTGKLNTSAVTESAKITFSDVTTGQTVTVGGLTFTATQNATAAQVAASFGALADNATSGVDSTYGTWTGKFTGFTSTYTASETFITATSTTAATNVADIAVNSSGNPPTLAVTNGAPASSISFFKNSGSNAEIISNDLVYSFTDINGNAALGNRKFTFSVDVAGSIPALRAGDLKINGIEIGSSHAEDDPFSPSNNASGSAIAKAAAINRMANATGITRGESQMLTFSGTPSPGTIVVGGVSVTLDALDNTSAKAAAKIAAALQASPQFGDPTGRSIDYTAGNSALTINYAPADGNIANTSIAPGSTGLMGVVDVTQDNYTSTAGTGVYAKVNQNILTGKAMSGTSVVKGVVFINGYASANIATTLNNTRATRADVVKAINLISDKTGVKAIDTGSDAKGVTLVAADGRNIEVSFETSANADDFGSRIGLRQGVQASTISLESKIPTPVVLSSSSTGDIRRAGLVEGNFTRNQAVANTSTRSMVSPSVSQVDSLLVDGTILNGDTFTAIINGNTYTYTATTAGGLTKQVVRDGLVSEINKDKDLKVTAVAGRTPGELLLTSDIPGTSFTFTTSKVSTTGTMTSANLVESESAAYKPLGMDDLMINGVKIPPSKASDDTFSPTGPTSSDRSASAIAIAAAINSQTPVTGVTAIANGAVVKGSVTSTSLPNLTTPTYQSLFVNGTKIDVLFVKDETGTARRTKVVEAINARTGQHGVTAVDNGNGVSLNSDGRNLAVWFDSDVKDLSAANFGLDNGNASKQVARVTVAGTASATASVTINGVTITTASADSTVAGRTTKLAAAISAAVSAGTIKNIDVSTDTTNGFVTIVSTVSGSPFEINGASSGSNLNGVTVSEITENSYGSNQITGIRGGNETSTTARTVYGTVRMIASAPQMPGLPMPIGAPPSDYETLLRANGKPFTVSSGADGFGPNSNFEALGFHEGTYGGRSSSEMDPPKVGRLAFQVGASANQLITIDLADFGKAGTITGDITGDVDLNIEQRSVRINTREGASAVLAKLDDAMDKVNATRATMGAVMNRLDHVINNLTNVSMNMSASRSQIEDADYAAASTELAKNQIMQQAGTAVLAQANTSQQSVLKLLGG
jgi:flagellin